MNVSGRRGWSLGTPITSGSETRASLTHIETKWVRWIYGDTSAERLQAAREAIDSVYEARWTLMGELIAQGDFHGPNVRVL